MYMQRILLLLFLFLFTYIVAAFYCNDFRRSRLPIGTCTVNNNITYTAPRTIVFRFNIAAIRLRCAHPVHVRLDGF